MSTRFKRIALPEDPQEKERKLAKYNGARVLVQDEHDQCDETVYRLGTLSYDPNDPQIYGLVEINLKGNVRTRQLHVNDLMDLMIKLAL